MTPKPSANATSPPPHGPFPALDAAEWRAVLDAVDDPIFLHDAATGAILDVNRAACELYGWSPAEFRGLAVADISSGQPPYSQEQAREWVSRAATEGPQRFEWRCRDRGGRLFWSEVSLRRAEVRGQARVVASVREISDRKRAEEALRESEARFQSAFRDAGIGMALSSPDGAILQANRSLCQLLGYGEGELQGRSFFDLTHPEDRAPSRARLDQLLTGEVPTYQIQKRYLAKGAKVVWASVNVSAVRDEAGRVLYQICQVEDVTERRRAEDALRESEQRYQSAFRHAGIGMAMCAPDGRFLQVNRSLCALLGYGEEELRALTFLDVTHPDDREVSQAHLARLFSGEVSNYHLDKRYLTRGGETRWAAVTVTLVRDASGAPLHTVSQIRDITVRRHAEEALRVSEERYRQLVETMTDGLVVRDHQGRILYANRRFCELLGLPRSEVVGRDVEDFLDEDNRGIYRAEVAKRPSGGRESYELTWTSRTGARVHTRMAPHPIREPDGAFLGSFAVVSDITERRRMEDALRESEEKYRTLVETTGTGYVIADADGRILDANPEYVRLTGHRSLDEIRGRSALEWTAPGDRERNAAAIAQCLVGGVLRSFSVEYVDAQGNATPLEINATALETAGGPRILGLCQDVSERRAAERELQRSRSLETIGRLAGGVAHDFNNILGSILGAVYVARMEADGEAIAAELDRIQLLCRRGGDLTRQLLTVARRRSGQEEVMDAAGAVEEIRALLEHTLPRDIRLVVDIGEGLPAVRADRSLFTTGLLNLALNARDAMPAGGELRVRAARRRDEGGAEWLEVEVADTGEGVPSALRERIFEPFFTTKAVGAGSGLGLSTVQGAVQEWGGEIGVASEPGQGSTFTVRLPAWAGGRAASKGLGVCSAPTHPLTEAPLLVVEDEDGVARLMTLTLEAWGYQAVRAANGLEALERLQDRRGAFGLVILDLVLPELGGEQVYRVLRGLAPEVPVLLVSGREDLARALAPDGPRLTKPFTAEEFLDGVGRALRGAA